eukprot:4459870-Pleurochrysis_carterae.AAC.3
MAASLIRCAKAPISGCHHHLYPILTVPIISPSLHPPPAHDVLFLLPPVSGSPYSHLPSGKYKNTRRGIAPTAIFLSISADVVPCHTPYVVSDNL